MMNAFIESQDGKPAATVFSTASASHNSAFERIAEKPETRSELKFATDKTYAFMPTGDKGSTTSFMS